MTTKSKKKTKPAKNSRAAKRPPGGAPIDPMVAIQLGAEVGRNLGDALASLGRPANGARVAFHSGPTGFHLDFMRAPGKAPEVRERVIYLPAELLPGAAQGQPQEPPSK